MQFSLIQAAKQIGVSRSSMHRYIKGGRVSATKLDNGGYAIDAAELFRAFPSDRPKRGSIAHPIMAERDGVGQDETSSGASGEAMALRAEVRLLREMLDQANLDRERERREASEAIEDYRRRLDREGEERRSLSARLLTYQTPPPAAP